MNVNKYVQLTVKIQKITVQGNKTSNEDCKGSMLHIRRVKNRSMEPTLTNNVLILTKTFRFEAAHFLPEAGADHKCVNMHGHSWKVEITVRGKIDAEKGWFMDYSDIKSAWRKLENLLDHSVLNEIEGLENPTSELLAVWIWDKLVGKLSGLHAITIFETETSKCTFFGKH